MPGFRETTDSVEALLAPTHKPTANSMVTGMAARKVTVTLPEEQVDTIRDLVAAGSAASVSGFVQHAVALALDDVAGWGTVLAEALRETGGPLTDAERAWVDSLLDAGHADPAA